jgi:hypothetical protein
LWSKEGVPIWDVNKEETFDLRALLFVTINDLPALSNLSGQSDKGYKACTHCLEGIESIYLRNYLKVVYMGHHRFLPKNHPLRKKGKHFKGEPDTRPKPFHHLGKYVHDMVKDVIVIFGKGSGIQPILNDEDRCAAMWRKKSIFWELPYWQISEVCNGIDVMHLTKNLCMNLLAFLDVYGASKDTIEAREDFKQMEQQENLHPE